MIHHHTGDPDPPLSYPIFVSLSLDDHGRVIGGVQGSLRVADDRFPVGVREAIPRLKEGRARVLQAVFVANTTNKLKAVMAAVESLRESVASDLEAIQAQIGGDLDSVRRSLIAEIADLAAAVGRISRPDPSAMAPRPLAQQSRDPGGGTVGPDGRRWEHDIRGKVCDFHTPPLAGGTQFGQNLIVSLGIGSSSSHHTDSAPGLRAELPQFDGSNPKLWQRRCEEYFQRWQTPSTHWASYALDHFVGDATTWLESYLQQHSSGRNLFSLSWLGSVGISTLSWSVICCVSTRRLPWRIMWPVSQLLWIRLLLTSPIQILCIMSPSSWTD